MAAVGEAREIADRLGARPLLGEVDRLVARARLDLAGASASTEDAVAAPAVPDPFGLTPRERDVLALLVLGRTNKQIADELFISESTAGVHVSNIIGKLGATTRTEAAAIAVRARLDGAATVADREA